MNTPLLPNLLLAVDVGTESVRAGLFDEQGRRLSMASRPIRLHRPIEDHVEQSSTNIWEQTCLAVRETLETLGIDVHLVRGLAFDATCSLVALDAADQPASVSLNGQPDQNVMVWMDHRATAQAARINATRHPVLSYVGGCISPEMQLPKLLWLKEQLPDQYRRGARYFDLADFLVYRATASDVRSRCTTVCKWTYLGHERRWDESFFQLLRLDDLLTEGKIGTRVAEMGELAGRLSPQAAMELGLPPGIAVASALIDAHSGALAVLGKQPETTLALIAGTSSCHMTVSREPRPSDGVWGPYHGALLPDLWLNEGGQSASGALLDHLIQCSAIGVAMIEQARREGRTVYALLNEEVLRLEAEDPNFLRHYHLLGDFHGNRSPRADPDLRGMISGLSLNRTVAELARAYLAALEAIAYGTRHIIETLREGGQRIERIHLCGGAAQNPLWLREHADATGLDVHVAEESECMLLGGAMAASVAAGIHPSLTAASAAMRSNAESIAPRPSRRDYHHRKYRVFQSLYQDQMRYRDWMTPP